MTDNTERFVRATDLISSGRTEEAAGMLRDILGSQPRHLAAAQTLAGLLEAGRADGDAGLARRTARKIEAEAAYNVGRTALANARYDVAFRCYSKAVELDPEHDDAIWGLAEACHARGDADAAVGWYRRYLALHPDSSGALHMIAALGGAEAPSRASDDYVRETFDDFAEDFDRQLLEDLNYEAPRLLASAFAAATGGEAAGLDILDAGCGTGLSGLAFLPVARRLVGVDLSPGMLDKARVRDLYDALEEAEVGAYCAAHPSSFDLIVAADVFCYFGDLSQVLAQAFGALRPGGWLVFSVEAAASGRYALTSSGRYSHSDPYVRACADAAGFDVADISEERLRLEYGEPVRGLVVVLEKGRER